jgi:VanZ family protein
MFRILFWITLLALEILSIVPARDRPVLGPHALEHAAAFALLGTLFALAYEIRTRTALAMAVLVTGAVELSQLVVVGRHARWSDFIIDAAAGIAGILIGTTIRRKGPAAGRQVP